MIHGSNRTATSHAGPSAWDARLQRSRIECGLSEAAGSEIADALRKVSSESRVVDVAAAPGTLPRLRDEIEACRRRVECEERAVLIRAVPGLTFHERRALAWIVANLLGEPLVQNTDGDRLIAVYARPGTKRIAEGARYHQTREGGGVHTDNVNLPDFWEYLVFSCIRPARVGGESILLSGFAVHQELLQVPEALAILRQPFWWEYRGISDDLYRAPIVTYNDAGEPHFRYLRRYLESAHARAGDPLTAEQAWALDTLDAILDMQHLQFRTKLSEGEILVTHDSQVLHSRTAFADESAGAPADLMEAAAGSCRFFDRVWVRKRLPHGD